MPLPILPLVNPETTTYRTGKGYDDLDLLFKDLHEGVLELGVGQCQVRCKDEPMRLQIGFELYTEKDGVARWWEFMIGLTRLRTSDRKLRARLMTTEERAKVAAEFESGVMPVGLTEEPSMMGPPQA